MRSKWLDVSVRKLGFILFLNFTVLIQPVADVPVLQWNDAWFLQNFELDPEFLIEWFDTSKGLPSLLVNDMLQTSDGYLWFATNQGLSRYDGVLHEVIPSTRLGSVFPNDPTALLTHGHPNVLWVSRFGGVSKIFEGKIESWDVEERFRSQRVWRIWPEASQSLWLSWQESLLSFQNGQFKEVQFDSVNFGELFSTFRLPSGSVVLGGKKGLWLWDDRSEDLPVQIFTSTGAPVKEVNRMLQLSDGRVLVSRPSGLGEYRDGLIYPLLEYDRGDLSLATAFLFESDDHWIWLGVSKLGLFRLPLSDLSAYQELEFFRGMSLGSAFQDLEGNIWIASSDKGVARIWRRPVDVWTPKSEYRISPCNAVINDPERGVWVGTDDGVFHIQDGEIVLRSKHLSMNRIKVRYFAYDSLGRLWFGTEGYLGLCLNGYLFRPYEDHCLLEPNENPQCMVSRGDGSIWVGCRQGLFYFDPLKATYEVDGGDGPFICLPELHRVPFGLADGEPKIQVMQEDSKGALWVGTDGQGLLQELGSNLGWKQYGLESGLKNLHVMDLCFDEEEYLWVATDGGIHVLIEGRFRSITRDDGLFDDIINSVDSDGQGGLWLGTNKGIIRLSREELIYSNDQPGYPYLSQSVYSIEDGMPVSEVFGGHGQSSEVMADGRICFATNSGLAIVDPDFLERNDSPPPVTLRKVEIDQKVAQEWWTFDVTKTPRIVVPPGRGHLLEIFFSANTFAGSGEVSYQYQLKGFDEKWVRVLEGRSATYTDLKPGTYRFEMMAANRHGVWSTNVASLDLEVLPMFVQTFSFKAMIGAGGLTLFLLFHLWCLRHREVRSKLEMMIRLEGERSRIAGEMHDDVGNQLARITYLSTMQGVNGGKDRLEKIGKVSRECIASMNEIIWAISTENDTINGLFQYVQEYVLRLGEDTDARIEPQITFPNVSRSISSEFRRNIFLTVKEALNNAIKHSGAARIEVELRVLDGQVQGAVRDAGNGITQDLEDSSGYGLNNMRERIESMGGTLTVESVVDGGVAVSFKVPIQ